MKRSFRKKIKNALPKKNKNKRNSNESKIAESNDLEQGDGDGDSLNIDLNQTSLPSMGASSSQYSSIQNDYSSSLPRHNLQSTEVAHKKMSTTQKLKKVFSNGIHNKKKSSLAETPSIIDGSSLESVTEDNTECIDCTESNMQVTSFSNNIQSHDSEFHLSSLGDQPDSEISLIDSNRSISFTTVTLPTIDEHYITITNDTKEQVPSSTPYQDVLVFLEDPSSCSMSLTLIIHGSLSHTNLTRLYHDYGYRKDILTFCVIEHHINGNINCDEEQTWLSEYKCLNKRRLFDSALFNVILNKSSELLTMKKRLGRILKEKANNSLMCIKCRKTIVSILYLPCGHVLLCDQCNEERDDRCGSCGVKITETHHIYL